MTFSPNGKVEQDLFVSDNWVLDVEIEVEHELDTEQWWEQSFLICTECGVNA